jgi:hypothetical protein
MTTRRDKNDLEGEQKSPQDTKETHNTPKKASKAPKGGGKGDKDELDEVETIPREQALKEMHEAILKAKKADKKS